LARPTKQGIDYFPVDVNFDDKIEIFIAKEGAEGLGILLTLWQLIYSNEGYYIKNDDNLVMLIRRRTMSDVEIIQRVIHSLLTGNVFSEKKEKKYGILTSKAIQKRYLEAAKRKKQVIVDKNYLCMGVNAYNNGVNVNINATKEEVEVEVKKRERGKFSPPSITEIEQYVAKNGLSVDPHSFFKFYKEGNWKDSNGNPVTNWKQKVLSWNRHSKGHGDNNGNGNPVSLAERLARDLKEAQEEQKNEKRTI